MKKCHDHFCTFVMLLHLLALLTESPARVSSSSSTHLEDGSNQDLPEATEKTFADDEQVLNCSQMWFNPDVMTFKVDKSSHFYERQIAGFRNGHFRQ